MSGFRNASACAANEVLWSIAEDMTRLACLGLRRWPLDEQSVLALARMPRLSRLSIHDDKRKRPSLICDGASQGAISTHSDRRRSKRHAPGLEGRRWDALQRACAGPQPLFAFAAELKELGPFPLAELARASAAPVWRGRVQWGPCVWGGEEHAAKYDGWLCRPCPWESPESEPLLRIVTLR